MIATVARRSAPSSWLPPGSWRCRSRPASAPTAPIRAAPPPSSAASASRPGGRPAPRARDRGRHAGSSARPRPPAHHRPQLGRDPRPGRGRSHAGHGLHPRYPLDPGPAAGSTPEPPLQRDLLERDPQPGGGPAGPAGIGPGHPAQYADRARAPGRAPGGPRAQARAPVAPGAHLGGRPGTRLHPHQAWCEQAGRAAVAGRHRDRRDPRQQVAAATRPRPERLQGRARDPADCDRGRRPRPGHRAACRTSSTTSCRWCRPTTSTGSAVPVVPERRATPSPWSASTRCRCCATSSACSARRSCPRRWPASNRTAPFAPSRYGCAPAAGSAASAGAARAIVLGRPWRASSRDDSVPRAKGGVSIGNRNAGHDHWTSLPGERKRR